MMLEALQSTQDPDWVLSPEGCGVLTESAVESLFAFGNRFMGMRAARSISPGPTWAGRLGCGDRRDDPPFAADRADRGSGLSRHDPDRLRSLLETDGLRYHRRPLRRDLAHPLVPARALCRLVPRQGAAQE